jgi:spore coat protein A
MRRPYAGTPATAPGIAGCRTAPTYIHHCDVLEHEDDDLMRPWTIVQDGG